MQSYRIAAAAIGWFALILQYELIVKSKTMAISSSKRCAISAISRCSPTFSSRSP